MTAKCTEMSSEETVAEEEGEGTGRRQLIVASSGSPGGATNRIEVRVGVTKVRSGLDRVFRNG